MPSLHTFLGNGDRTFRPVPEWTVAQSDLDCHPVSMTPRDLNGDGLIDLVITGEYVRRFTYLITSPDGWEVQWSGIWGRHRKLRIQPDPP